MNLPPVDQGTQRGDRRHLKEFLNFDSCTKLSFDASEQSHDLKRVPATKYEVVINASPNAVEHFTPDAGHCTLERRMRSLGLPR